MSRNAVVIIADEKQFPPAVFLASRLASLRNGRDVDIKLATDSEACLAQARAFGGPFEVLDIRGIHRDLALPVSGYFTKAAYYSLFLPTLLQGGYRRAIYLDVDVYPESENLFRLFDLDMNGRAIAGVRDLQVSFLPNQINRDELQGTLGLGPDRSLGAKYLNTGVLLVDIGAYARRKFQEQAVRIIRERQITLSLVDQTVFNLMLRGHWLELSPAFNMVTRTWSSLVRRFSPPVVVHFTGAVKPWHRAFIDDHPVRHEMPAFLKDTPWSAFIEASNPPPRLVNVQASALPSPPALQLPLWDGEPLAALIAFLRGTAFADVDQGITALDRSQLPTEPVTGIVLDGLRP